MRKISKILLLMVIIGFVTSTALIETSAATSEKNQYFENEYGASYVDDSIFGQTFALSKCGQIDKIEIFAKRTQGNSTLSAKIYATNNGVATGDSLGTSNSISASNKSSVWTVFTFTQNNRANLIVGVMYAFIIADSHSNKNITYYYQNSNSYTAGTRLTGTAAIGTGDLLFRLWMTPDTCAITFNSNGGTAVNTITNEYGTAVTAPTNPTKTGYSFDGWYSDIGLTTPYTFSTMTATLTLYAKWIIIAPHYITYAANDSTGGTVPADKTGYNPGSIVTTQSNKGFLYKEGYGFSQWNTMPDGSGVGYPVGTGTFVMGTSNVTLYPIYIKTEVTLKDKASTGLTVNIKGWQTNFRYQIWNYSELTSDIFLAGTLRNTNQWLLSMSYSLGFTGAIQPDGSINYHIDLFTSPTNNYTIAVRVTNENSDYVGVLKDILTEAEYIKITKILVDGVFANGTVTKEIKSGASVAIKIISNIIPGTEFSAKVIETDQVLTSESGNSNLFVWDISSKNSRIYTLRFTVSNNGINESMDLQFVLYNSEGMTFSSIDSMTLDLNSSMLLPRDLTITPDYMGGYFFYKISEPCRAEYFKSSTTTSNSPIIKSMTAYGIFMVTGITNQTNIGPNTGLYDDGIIKFINVARSKESSSITLTSDVVISPTVQKRTAITFTGEAAIAGIGATPIQYSFWRFDAKGYSLIKDWSSNNTLDWKPARVGEYSIEVRAKGEDALSYEVAKSINVKVVDTEEKIAENVVISINSTYLNANALARHAIVITATVSSETDDDLLYNFIVSDDDMLTTVFTGYSTEPEYVWVPREARKYIVTVFVKNSSSYGKFDASKSFDITVNVE